MPSAVSCASPQNNVPAQSEPSLCGRSGGLKNTDADTRKLAQIREESKSPSLLKNLPCARISVPDIRSSASLLKVLTEYHERKPKSLPKDLAKHPDLKKFLEFQGSKLLFKHDQLDDKQFKELLLALKSAGHKSGNHLRGALEKTWSAAPQLASDKTPDNLLPTPQATLGNLNSSQPSEDGLPAVQKAEYCNADELNPFANEPDPEETTSVLYPEDLCPFEGDADTEQTAISPLNPFDEPDEIQEALPPAAQLDMTFGPPAIFLRLLNSYLRTEDGNSFGKIVDEHVKKLKKDIDKTPIIAQLLTLAGEAGQEHVQWKVISASKEDMQQVLDAFRTRHKGKSSFYTLLSQFAFPAAGYRLLSETAHNKIIERAAQPAPHLPGKSAVVEMKHTSMVEALQHFSSPERHDQPLLEGVLDPLIGHYGRVEKDRARAQQSLEKLAGNIQLSLNDAGIVEAIKRFFRQVSTEGRIDRFDQDVIAADALFREKMLKMLEQVQAQHAPEPVAARTREKLSQHLEEAYKQYAEVMQGANIYPERLSEAATTQIKNKARQNFHAVLQDIVARYEAAFVGHLNTAVSSFSPADFFKNKSREHAVGNVIKINNELSTLNDVATDHHQKNMAAVEGKFKGSQTLNRLSDNFQELQQGLAANINMKFLSNYQGALGLYEPEVEKVNTVRSDNSSDGLENTRKLTRLSRELATDIGKVRNQADDLKLDKSTLNQAVQKTIKPLLEKIRERLPEVESIRQTLKSAFIRAFKPTPTRMLYSIPLLGGLALALSTLPTAIAVPLGIVSAVTLPLALLGWVGWNIYKRFDQRSEITHLRAETEKHLKTIETDNR